MFIQDIKDDSQFKSKDRNILISKFKYKKFSILKIITC